MLNTGTRSAWRLRGIFMEFCDEELCFQVSRGKKRKKEKKRERERERERLIVNLIPVS